MRRKNQSWTNRTNTLRAGAMKRDRARENIKPEKKIEKEGQRERDRYLIEDERELKGQREKRDRIRKREEREEWIKRESSQLN